MNYNIPGTVLPARQQDMDNIEHLLDSLFLAGGVMLGQISNLTGLEPYRIQNWVKRGFLAPPQNKRYSRSQLCRILNIHTLQAALPMEKICSLLTYVNGALDDESDDLIDDSDLYCMFVHLVAHPEPRSIEAVLSDYQEPVPGAKQRVADVLQVMLSAWKSAVYQAEAEELLKNLSEKE